MDVATQKTFSRNKKLVGGIATALTLALIVFLGVQCTDAFTDKVADVFEPSSIMNHIEGFTQTRARGSPPPPRRLPTGAKAWTNAQKQATQLSSYQMYQQAVNAATPTASQLMNASNQPGGGFGYNNVPNAPGLVPPAGQPFYDAAAVDYGNRRAELISPCAQNAPTFVASSLLPQVNVPGQPSWNVLDTQALANQNFLAATQQIGVDTVLSSLRNPSYDLRNNIPNPINVVSPWLNTTITPDLERRPLDCYIPENGMYGCGPAGCSYNSQNNPLTGRVARMQRANLG